MSDTSVATANLTAQRGLPAEARFLVPVSRPGLWSTTALFYLLPLGRADFVLPGGVLSARRSANLGVVRNLLLAVGVYNAPRVAWKGNPPFDVLIQASYLLVFVLSSWLNKVPPLPWQTFVFGALFAMHSHVFCEVMDIEPDQLSGRKTTARVIGRVAAKLLIAAFLGVETWLVRFYFRDWIVAVFLALGALWFVLDATLFWKDRRYLPKEMRLFLWGWNIAALLGILWNWTQSNLTHLHR